MISLMLVETLSMKMIEISPGLIKNASSEINNIAQQRINQIITEGGKEIKMVPNILRGAIDNVYRTPFHLLGKLVDNSFKN